MPPSNFQHILSCCAVTGSVTDEILLLKVKVFGLKHFWAGYATLVTTFVQTACISLAPNHVPQYQAFHTALYLLMFNLPLRKSNANRQTLQHFDEKQYCNPYIA